MRKAISVLLGAGFVYILVALMTLVFVWDDPGLRNFLLVVEAVLSLIWANGEYDKLYS